MRTAPYYVDVSHRSVRTGSFTVWSNLWGIVPMLTFCASICDYDVRGRDGDHFCLVVDVKHASLDFYNFLSQTLRDCATVENLLVDVNLEETAKQ